MVDIVDRKTRSRMMASIRSKDTKPELALRAALHRLGLRFRLHASGLPGRPDIILPRHHAAIQVHGCFWHRHAGCTFATTPGSNTAFWEPKFSQTIERDKRNLEALRQLGWRVAVSGECAIRQDGADDIAKKIASWLASGRAFKEIPAAPSVTAVRAVPAARVS